MTQARKWSIGTAAVVVLLLAASWFLAISPQRAKAADLDQQTASVQASNEQLQVQIATLQQQQKQLPKWQAQLAALRDQLPPSPALPSLIRQLSDASDKAGVKLLSLSPATPAVVATSTTTTAAGTGLQPGTLAGLDVQLTLSGGYFEVQQFVNNLERLERVMLVTGVNLAEESDETGGAGTLTASVTGRVFLVPPGEPVTTTTTTTTGTTPAGE